MKPLNLDNRPCNPISSNCVIWQGPDISCINLCSGDTVSDVVYKLATELCLIMDQLNLSNYDLDCLASNSPAPENFQDLIQLLIVKVCNINGIEPIQQKSRECPDCVVSVAPCFVEGNQTTMQLVDYVKLIGTRVCDIVDQIDVINNQITNIDIRVTALEDAPPPTFTLPSISTSCLSDYMGFVASAPIDQILDTLVNNSTIGYCALIQATGLPAELLSAVATQCVEPTDDSLANPGETMASAYFGTWINDPVTVADAITNIWISLCDLRDYVLTLTNTIVEAGDNVTVTPNTVGNTTTYTVDGKDTVVEAGDNITVTSNVVDNTTTYTVNAESQVDVFTAAVVIGGGYQAVSGEIPIKPTTTVGFAVAQGILKYTHITSNNVSVTAPTGVGTFVANIDLPPCSFGTFNNETGAFTVSEEGTYLIQGSYQLKNTTSSAFWQTTGIGTVGVGLVPGNGQDVYTGNYTNTIGEIAPLEAFAIPQLHRQISASTSVVTKLGVGGTAVLTILNLSDHNYDGRLYSNADIIRFSITKLK